MSLKNRSIVSAVCPNHDDGTHQFTIDKNDFKKKSSKKGKAWAGRCNCDVCGREILFNISARNGEIANVMEIDRIKESPEETPAPLKTQYDMLVLNNFDDYGSDPEEWVSIKDFKKQLKEGLDLSSERLKNLESKLTLIKSNAERELNNLSKSSFDQIQQWVEYNRLIDLTDDPLLSEEVSSDHEWLINNNAEYLGERVKFLSNLRSKLRSDQLELIESKKDGFELTEVETLEKEAKTLSTLKKNLPELKKTLFFYKENLDWYVDNKLQGADLSPYQEQIPKMFDAVYINLVNAVKVKLGMDSIDDYLKENIDVTKKIFSERMLSLLNKSTSKLIGEIRENNLDEKIKLIDEKDKELDKRLLRNINSIKSLVKDNAYRKVFKKHLESIETRGFGLSMDEFHKKLLTSVSGADKELSVDESRIKLMDYYTSEELSKINYEFLELNSDLRVDRIGGIDGELQELEEIKVPNKNKEKQKYKFKGSSNYGYLIVDVVNQPKVIFHPERALSEDELNEGINNLQAVIGRKMKQEKGLSKLELVIKGKKSYADHVKKKIEGESKLFNQALKQLHEALKDYKQENSKYSLKDFIKSKAEQINGLMIYDPELVAEEVKFDFKFEKLMVAAEKQAIKRDEKNEFIQKVDNYLFVIAESIISSLLFIPTRGFVSKYSATKNRITVINAPAGTNNELGLADLMAARNAAQEEYDTAKINFDNEVTSYETNIENGDIDIAEAKGLESDAVVLKSDYLTDFGNNDASKVYDKIELFEGACGYDIDEDAMFNDPNYGAYYQDEYLTSDVPGVGSEGDPNPFYVDSGNWSPDELNGINDIEDYNKGLEMDGEAADLRADADGFYSQADIDYVQAHGEPFIDTNGNGIRDAGESYTDVDGNGEYTVGYEHDMTKANEEVNGYNNKIDDMTTERSGLLQYFGLNKTKVAILGAVGLAYLLYKGYKYVKKKGNQRGPIGYPTQSDLYQLAKLSDDYKFDGKVDLTVNYALE